MTGFPRLRPVGDAALLVEFAERLDDDAHAAVLRLDAQLAADPFPGFAEAVPAYVALLVGFDPLATDHAAVAAAVRARLAAPAPPLPEGSLREIAVCYEPEVAPDLPEVARAAGMSPEAVIAAHLAGDYRVAMFGFAPGYAYLAGTPAPIRLPRRPSPVRGVPAGAVLIAGPQCLVTTLTMPTGWWILGRSPTPILREDAGRPVAIEVGDRVRFRRVGLDALPGPAGPAA